MKKNTFFIVWISMILFLFMPQFSFADESESIPSQPELITSGDFVYLTDPYYGTILRGYTGNSEELTLPTEIDGHKIDRMGAGILSDNNTVKTLYIPEGYTAVSAQAFRGSKSLEKVIISGAVRDVAYQSFWGCTNLREVVFEEGVESIGNDAFLGCTSLQSVCIPASVKAYGQDYSETPENPFTKCTSLTEISIADGNDCLSVINGCVCLNDSDGKPYHLVTYPAGRKEELLEVPDGVVRISRDACAETAIKELHLPASVEEIAFKAFDSCTGLEKVTGGEGLRRIENGAFAGCTSMNEFSLPDTIEYISASAFYGCDNYLPNIPGDMTQTAGGSWIISHTLQIKGEKQYDKAFEVLEKVNEVRSEKGLPELQMDERLMEDAMQRAAEIAVYFYHYRPNGASCETIENGNDELKIEGENIAAGSPTSSDVMNMWMNSSGHRANILKDDGRNTIGIGCVIHNGTIYWVQLFGKTESVQGAAPKQNTPAEKFDIEVNSAGDALDPFIGYDWPDRFTSGEVRQLYLKSRNKGWAGQSAVIENSGIIWTSSDKSIATVTDDGKLTAVSTGNVTITASLGRLIKASVDLTIDPACEHKNEYTVGMIEANCISEGYTGDVYCYDCNELLRKGSVLPVDKSRHARLKYLDYIPPTEDAEGLTDGYVCEACGTVVDEQQVIPKTGAEEETASADQVSDNDHQGGGEQKPDYQQGSGEQKPDYQQGGGEQKPYETTDAEKAAAEPSVDPVNQTGTDGTAQQTGTDGTALGPGASAQAAEAAITGMTSDNDLPGSVFSKLQLRSKKQTKTSITLSWKNVTGAKKYIIYGNKCGKKTKPKKLATVKAKDVKTYTKKFRKVAGSKISKGTYYKFMIVAIDKDNKVVSSSKIIHVATKGGKVGNVSKVTTKAKKNKVSIRKGKKFKLDGKQVAASKKLKVREHRKVTYETTNPKIAKVSKKGVITGKKKGTCYVYAYAQNGVFAKIRVAVK